MGSGSRGWVRGRFLGRGSTAAVYLGASTSDDRGTFAVKSVELSRSAPLQREEKILSSLCSSHIVSCLGSDVTFEPDGRVLYNLFVEYVPGGDLSQVVKQQGCLDEHAIRVYSREVLDGLAYLHSRGIVHCDVKGHNILVSKDGSSAKLADLGCARRVDDGSDGRWVISGTPLYMAPEVARGEEQGPAADIWALGCTMIEMATGCPPWRNVSDEVAAIHRIAFSDDVPEFPCNISGDARDFLGRCLGRDPRKRWSAEELLSHPFLKCCGELLTDRSPKSTLDQGFWDSWPEEEDEEEGEEEDEAKPNMDNQPPESIQERVRQLFGDGFSLPPRADATWDESCWVMIRNSSQTNSEPSASGSPRVDTAARGVCGEELPGYDDVTAIATKSSMVLDVNGSFLSAVTFLVELRR